MKPIAYLTAAMVLAVGVAGAAAQAPIQSFMGTVKSVTGSSLTVERVSLTGVFTVDTKTHVAAKGASTKTKENKEAGKPGLTVPDAVHVGDLVVVKYREVAGTMLATDIQVRNPAPGTTAIKK